MNYNTVGTERQQDSTFWSTDFMDSNSSTVVVTGFGPFRQYLVNPSWEAVKELSKRGLGNNTDLRIMQLPVAYRKAKEQVFKIWTTLQPLLTVHVGLASAAEGLIILEQCGKNKGYQEMDACGFLPEGACCVLDGPEKIESTINMKMLWKSISVEGVDIISSRDAGRYVCDYTYYASLYYGNGRAAFIHVPPLSPSVTADFLGKALQSIILEMLKQCGEGTG
ncbi:pyroglutamyl-peptidase 1-like protein [Pezoporus flaviventris]|uniref:pyroglutamyl-peptidase 1-like protein n=1 Tax=Pezoporus flaviventris TaxID=889875 RepID=UPI002AB109FB|nr:pyroglutamyl-peptidase 1-like protein [Pezoporus flaviventris]XP_061302687.1 pyroglutamyl-peptidase 1-like protein [Pezoporus flaviventris]XP_061302688.1 pyroglutamyl-peptidase 1-like protein [Pezoporus flaviventris]XP_061302689.1 pyroglutamyl-peptidase 1-like protein [Pezoporus flaviventris]XP_061302690.1 pyroglutamyl-peptidase 1-like protein [Pezoporus flaviventris]XP_061302691.1 pyroglutamyl-peptidase 1-like protein [Pezoporus flaviventris]